MNDSEPVSTASGELVCGLNPLELLDAGLRPSSLQGEGWTVLSPEEVAMMLPSLEISRLMGQGGMGAVYEGWQRDLQRRVAVKILSPTLTDTPGQATRFRHEARLMAQLHHAGIVRVFEAGETAEGHLFYVMEFIDGEDLASRMSRGPIPLEEAVVLVCEVAEALQAAHALGIIHRDVKPGNILLPAGGAPKLGDFGLALTIEQAADSPRLTRLGTTMGTIEYAAPEQLSKSAPVSAASDVYSLGVLTYELLTGELPRGRFDPPSVRNLQIDPAFDGVVLRALQSDPLRRFKDAGEFRAALQQAADRRAQQARRDLEVRQKMTRRARIAGALAAVALITGGTAVVAWRSWHEANERRIAAEEAEGRMGSLMHFLITDLRQRLEPTGNLGAMESVLDKAEEYFRGKYETAGHSAESAITLADVLEVKANVIGVRGLGDEAEALYSEAIALTTQARQSTPDDVVRQLRLVKAWQDRSEHRMLRNQFQPALEDAREMLQLARAIRSAPPPSNTDVVRAIAAAHKAVANALGYQLKLDESREEYLAAQKELAELAAAHPDNSSLAEELSGLDISLGSVAETQGDFAGMLRYFTAWHEYISKRYGPDQFMYSYSAFRMAVAMIKLQRPREAIPYLESAIPLVERELARKPGHKGVLNHLLWCLRLMADAQTSVGNTVKAADYRRREEETSEQWKAAPEVDRPKAGSL